MRQYKVLEKNIFCCNNLKIVPIRDEDKYDIMRWRNEQIYHLRQNKPLSHKEQDTYFATVVSKLFELENPNQLLFSYLDNDSCIGYGGIVHINWVDKHAEISFVMNTSLEKEYFEFHWNIFLSLIEKVAFEQLNFRKIFTFAYDVRQRLFQVLEKNNYTQECRYVEHAFLNNKFLDVFIHSKLNPLNNVLKLRNVKVTDLDLLFDWVNDAQVRDNSINSKKIEYVDHVQWFIKKCGEINSRMYILVDGNINIGQIRIDYIENYWEIAYSISSKFRGLGYGRKIVELLINKFVLKNFKAKVKKNNLASIRVFQSLSFKQDEKNEDFFVFILNQHEE